MTAPNPLSPPKILVFDSGVGGLSVARAIQTQLPWCSLHYVADNAAFPYGIQSENALVQRINQVLRHLQQQIQADIIVIACNSASTIALPALREQFSVPIVGVVPAIKPAAAITRTGVIGLLATPGTIQRTYTRRLLDTFAQSCRIITLGCNELVHQAEAKLRQKTIDIAALKVLLQPFAHEPTLDTLVLACTHFPLIRPQLQEALPHIQHWVDSSNAIAQRVQYWVNEQQLCQTNQPPSHACYFTQTPMDMPLLLPALVQLGFEQQHIVVVTVP